MGFTIGEFSRISGLSIKALRLYHEKGYEIAGKHHEIYLSDFRRAAPEKLKTVIRQPFKAV